MIGREYDWGKEYDWEGAGLGGSMIGKEHDWEGAGLRRKVRGFGRGVGFGRGICWEEK